MYVHTLMHTASLSTVHNQLMSNITQLDNMLPEDETGEVLNSIEGMCQELGVLEEVMHLKTSVDCDCFYEQRS